MKKVFHDNSTEFTVYKMGNKTVNWYLITTPTEVYLIDTGFTGFWKQFSKAMKKLGRTYNEVSAILITHAHVDHTGFAEIARQRTSGEVYIHESAIETVMTDHFEIPEELLSNLWRPTLFFNFMWQAFKNDALKAKPVNKAFGFKDNEVLNFGGKPKVIFSPGHSIDHCAFYFEKYNLLFSGDAICTSSPITLKDYPPHVLKAGDDNKLAFQSLERFSFIENDVLLLPGHGKTWKGNLKEEIPKIRKRDTFL